MGNPESMEPVRIIHHENLFCPARRKPSQSSARDFQSRSSAWVNSQRTRPSGCTRPTSATIAHPRIYSSPVLRAIETSVILANRLDLDYEVVDALREYDCGIAEGRSDDVGWQLWQELFDAWVIHKRWGQKIEGGESFYDIRDRFVPFIEHLVSRYGDTETEIVCVSHGGTYWMMLPLVLENVDHKLISKHGFDYAACIVSELRPAGLFCIEWNGYAVD